MKIRKAVYLFVYSVPFLVFIITIFRNISGDYVTYGAVFTNVVGQFASSQFFLFGSLVDSLVKIVCPTSYIPSSFLFVLNYYSCVMFLQLCVEFLILIPSLIKKWLDRRLLK